MLGASVYGEEPHAAEEVAARQVGMPVGSAPTSLKYDLPSDLDLHTSDHMLAIPAPLVEGSDLGALSFTAARPLPVGLCLDGCTGAINGKIVDPNSSAWRERYTIIASNSVGMVTVDIDFSEGSSMAASESTQHGTASVDQVGEQDKSPEVEEPVSFQGGGRASSCGSRSSTWARGSGLSRCSSAKTVQTVVTPRQKLCLPEEDWKFPVNRLEWRKVRRLEFHGWTSHSFLLAHLVNGSFMRVERFEEGVAACAVSDDEIPPESEIWRGRAATMDELMPHLTAGVLWDIATRIGEENPYSLTERNCHHFARDVWNAVVLPQFQRTHYPDRVKSNLLKSMVFPYVALTGGRQGTMGIKGSVRSTDTEGYCGGSGASLSGAGLTAPTCGYPGTSATGAISMPRPHGALAAVVAAEAAAAANAQAVPRQGRQLESMKLLDAVDSEGSDASDPAGVVSPAHEASTTSAKPRTIAPPPASSMPRRSWLRTLLGIGNRVVKPAPPTEPPPMKLAVALCKRDRPLSLPIGGRPAKVAEKVRLAILSKCHVASFAWVVAGHG